MSDNRKNPKLTAEDILMEFKDKLLGETADPEVPPPDILIGDDEDAITVTVDDGISEERSEELLEDTPVDPDFEDDGVPAVADEEEKPVGKEPPCVYDPDEYEPDEIDLFTGFDEIIPDPQDTELSSVYFEEEEESVGEECEASLTEKANDTPEGDEKEESPEKPRRKKKEKSPEKEKSNFRDLFPRREDSAFEIIRKLVFLIAVIVFVAAGVLLAITLIQSKRAVDLKNTLTSELEQFEVTVVTSIDENGNVIEVEPTQEQQDIAAIDKLEYLKSKNPNTVGYLTMSGVDVYEPILQAEDNSYYLTHAFDGTENKAGAVFLDYRAEISADRQSDMLVLYGHNQRDGTMFGNLKHYKRDVDFYKRNPFITFETEYGSQKYVIFGFFVTNTLAKHDSNGEVFHYHDFPELYSEEVYTWYMEQVAKRNEIISPVDVTYGDKFLVLSTCSNEYRDSRFVVLARKLRPGESVSEIDVSDTRLNYGSSEIDWYAITSDITTTLDSSGLESSVHQSIENEWFATIGEALGSIHGSEMSDTDDTQNTESVSDTEQTDSGGTSVVTEPPESTSDTDAETAVPEVSDSSSSDSEESETSVITDENASEITEVPDSEVTTVTTRATTVSTGTSAPVTRRPSAPTRRTSATVTESAPKTTTTSQAGEVETWPSETESAATTVPQTGGNMGMEKAE